MRSRLLGVGLAALLAVGCSEAGMPYVSLQEAAKIGVATGRITVACGTVEEMRAFGPPPRRHLAAEESIAISGAKKLAGVYAHDHSRTYQGESVGGVVHDSIALLGNCGLPSARQVLLRALGHASD